MSEAPPRTLRWEGDEDGRLFIIEQTLLPAEEREVELPDVESVADAIRRLAVRGAPAIGVAAAYGLVLAAKPLADDAPSDACRAELDRAATLLAQTRPTAVNLAWAVDRMAGTWRAPGVFHARDLRRRLVDEALAIHDEDRAACEAMGRNALELVRDGGVYLTHCNAGALATGGMGTALAVFYAAAAQGMRLTVYADETRPLLQGARLTSWELSRAGIDVVLICDSAAAGIILSGEIHAVFVGSDRIAANGDVANKVGTLGVALAAHRRGIPFYVVAPSSTFDLTLASGAGIPIEDRTPEEITEGFGPRTAPPGVRVRNPAFDVTPAELVTAIVTEKGVIRPPGAGAIRALLGR